jgi:hypothetical protein
MSLYNKVKRIGRDAKIENLHPRILRSTYVVRLYNSEQDLRFVQQQAGHTSLRTTALYAIAAGGHLPVVTPDRADPEAIERTGYSRIQGMMEERAAERATSHRETVPVKDLQQTERCEVCGRPIGARGGTRIDSGQILCPDCLKELRSI